MVRPSKAGSSSNATRQVRDAEATQNQILDAAEEEFAKHGLIATRTEAIEKREERSVDRS